MRNKWYFRILIGLLTVVTLLTGIPKLDTDTAFGPAVTAEAATTGPKITTQPKSVSVASGVSARVKVVATGTGLSYKWYVKESGASKFVVSSIKTATYSVRMTESRNGRQLYCVVTDKYGNSVKTNTVTISMTSSVAITTQPKSVAVANGKTVTLKVAASGEGLTYKWYYKDIGSSKFSLSSTMKTATYTVAMSEGRNGRQLYCVVTDKYGNSVKTNTVTISMTSSVAITTQPKSVAVANGKTVTLKVAASGEGLTYKWYYKDLGASKFSLSSTMKTATYTVAMSEGRNGRQLYCVVTDKYGNSVKSDVVTLTMMVNLEIIQQPQTIVVPEGGEVKINLKAKGEGLTYKWYYKNANASTFSVTNTFTSDHYTTEMSPARNGRQVYCVVTDKHGNSVKTETATMYMGTPISITRQPTPVTVQNGGDVKISFSAEGEGLTYKWYYKNASASAFSVTKTFTSNYYTAEMSDARNGRQVYCVVTDKFGFTVTTDVVTMHIGMPITITMQPTSVTVDEGETAVVMVGAVGEGITYKWYYKNAGASKFSYTSTFTGGTYTAQMSDTRDGRQIYCVITDKNGVCVQTDTVTLSMTPAYRITVDLDNGETYEVGVKKDGKYKLTKPTRPGYTFQGWQTSAGKEFASSGTIDKSVTVKAIWRLVGTDTLEELITRTNSGATKILITGSITINQPIYISHDVTIYANGNHTLKRDPNYSGDLFVVGKDAKGVTSLLHHRKAVLTLGGGRGTLTIDGNRDNMKVDVVGSVIFAGDSSTVNLYDGVRICNNVKVGNDRLLSYVESSEESTVARAGGAAILNQNSVVNMYGGIIENNAVKTEHTITTDAQGAEVKNETAGCGGAVFSNGAFNMYGGTIRNNEALRGGAIYIMKPTTLVAGTIQGNRSHTYGGAVSTSASQYANLYIGDEAAGKTLLIKDNYSTSAGGALYSNTSAPIIVLGNALFEGNHSDYSGGAIYTGGSLVVRNSTFRGNSSLYSAGAIFFHNTKDSTWQPREAEITGCVFEENQASLGGAITFSRSNKDDPNATGVVAKVADCRFYKNEAIKNDANPGNGGAIYVTQLADATITGCEFTENVAASSGGGVSVNGQAHAKLTDSVFTGNTAVSGGGMYLSVDTTSTLNNLTFTGNKAVPSASGTGGTGGAIYGYSASVTMKNMDIRNNTAAQNGGAIYLNAITLTLGADTKIEGNSAGEHGGAFYLTYRTNEDNTKTGAKLILNDIELKGNTAKSGGAISIRTSCEATLNGAKLIENSATAPVEEVMGGGAVYVGYGKLTLNDTELVKNTSAYYGGAVFSRNSEVSITGGSVTESSGATGAALHFREGTEATLKNVSVTGNTSLANGVLYINGGKLDMVNVTASGNKASSGGVLYTSGSSTVVTLDNSTWSGNTASNGGAIYMNSANVTVKNSTFTENIARLGGAIYNTSGTLNTENTTFTKNAATKSTSGANGNGGAVTVVAGTYNVSESDAFIENTAENHAGAIYVSYLTNETDNTRTGGVLNVTGATFTGNTAIGGGAVSVRTDSEASFDGTVFTGNKVTGNDGKTDGYGEGGGAVYVGYGKLTLKDVTTTGNTSESYGGAVHLLDTDATVTGSTFQQNAGKHGGAIYVMSTSNVSVTDSSFHGNSATENAGAVYIGEEASAELKNLVFTDNHADSHGGALYNSNATVTTEKLTMTGNSAGGNGGAIYLLGKEMSVDSTYTFKNNSAGGHGGAIYLTYKTNSDNSRTGAVLNATDVIFEGNTAMTGGAISARSVCVVNLDGTILKDNSVTGFQNNGDDDPSDDNDGDGEGGGAIYVGYGQLTMNNVTATGNTASDFGGVIDAVGSPVTVTGGSFTGNSTNSGGVLHAMGGCNITVSGALFSGNASVAANTEYNSDIGGGVFHTEGGKLNITASTFDSNSSAYYGGVLHTNKTAVTIDGNTVFSGNTGATGAVMHMRSAKVILENVSLTNNTSNMNGVIYYAGSDLTLDAVTATGNKAYQGGVLFTNSSTVTAKDCTFSGNSATSGGVIYSKGGTTVNLENCEMAENAASYGGAVYLIENSKLNLTGVTFNKNSATKDGGAIYNKASVVTAIDTETAVNTFTENTAANHGGAIYVVYATSETDSTKLPGILNMTGGNFTGNTAMGGGAVSARTDCEASFDGTVFTENKSIGNDGTVDGYGEGGGAVYVGYGALTMKDVTATGNVSESYGGAVHLLDSDATVTGSTFEENEAADGGAIFAKAGGSAVITDSTFRSNTATASGGAVHVVAPATAELKNLVFDGNHADSHGGALYINMATVTTESLDMQNNSAGGNGGAVYLNGTEMTVTASDVFKGNSAGGHGGAVYLTYDANKNGAALTGSDAVFENNTAKAGGAISSRSYCNVELTGATLKGNSATGPQTDYLGGGAIYTNTNALKLHGVTLEGNTSAYYGGAISASEAQVTIDNKSVIKNNGAVTGVALYFRTSGSATLNDVTVTENVFTAGSSNGVIYLTGTTTLDVEKLTATDNKSVNGGVFFLSSQATGTIKDSVFTGNTANANGGVISFSSSKILDVTGCTISKNTAKNGGAIYCDGGTVNVKGCQLTENTATTSGGAISVAGKGVVNVAEETAVKSNTAPKGGAVYLDLGGTASITGITLEGNTATSGGAICVNDSSEDGSSPSTLTLTNATLKNNTARYGGAVDLENGSTVTVNGGLMTKNSATLGGAIYNRLGVLTLSDAVFTENTATRNASGGDGNGGAIVANGGSVTGSATFEKNTAENHAGALYLTYVKGADGAANIPGTANLTGGSFTENTAMGGGAVSIRSGCHGTFENVTFTGNSVSGWIDDGKDDTVDNDGDGEGGGAIYVGYGSVTLNNVTATGNIATDTFGGFLDSTGSVVNITGGSFSGNIAPAGGAIYGINNSRITVADATISENESTFINPYGENLDQYDNKMGGGAVAVLNSTLTISNTTMDSNKSVYYGGTILVSKATVTIDKASVVSGSTGKTGSAIYIRDNANVTVEDSSILNNKNDGSGVVYISYGTLDLINVTASGNSAHSGGVVLASGTGATVNVTGGTWSDNSATFGGVFYISNAKVNVTDATFTENTSHLGGAIYNTAGTLTLKDATFMKNTATKDSNGSNGNGGAVTVVGGTVTGSGTNVFKENTAENHAGAIYVSYLNNADTTKTGGVLNLTDGLFESNSASCGGAISSRTAGSVTLTGTVLKDNSATASSTGAQGGAIYSNAGSLTLSGVTLDGNTTNYYGAAVYSSGSVFTATDDCIVQNNTGITGAAVHLTINEGQTATITDMTLQKNQRLTGNANGTIYATGSGTLNITGLTATENVSSNGGVLYTSGGLTITIADSTLTDNEALTNGGVIAYRGTKSLTITGCTITGNTAPNGGVIEATGSGTVTIKSSTLESNTATEKGGAIYASGASAKVVISDGTTLKANTAKYGGAVYMDLGATVTIDSSTLDGNSATTGEGGAILVADTTKEQTRSETKLVMTGTTLQNNTSKTRGGALATAYDCPKVIINATNCTFYKNTSGSSGGAVCVQNCSCNSSTEPTAVNSIFTNCTFRENTATTDGGAIDVRSGSCIKIDGITAESNTATGNAGVVYVTSTCTRLYITGEVSCTGNTAKNGNFSYLYNNNYSTPPKIYTTHSNTATWYADVAGNKTNVAFDLTTLP